MPRGRLAGVELRREGQRQRLRSVVRSDEAKKASRYSVYLIYWYKSTKADAAAGGGRGGGRGGGV
jgi:hypothetical protein